MSDDVTGDRFADASASRRLRQRPKRDGVPVFSNEKHSVAFVCAANVCRSPLMATVFENLVASESAAGSWTVSSGGVRAPEGASVCDVVLSIVDDATSLAHHRARGVESVGLDDFQIIITASREERSAVARLRPALRGRTYTLREAIYLGSAPLSPAEQESLVGAGAFADGTLDRYAEILHTRRGLADPDELRGRFAWSRKIDPFDIPDVHGAKPRLHETVLKDVRQLVGVLHGQVSSLVSLDL